MMKKMFLPVLCMCLLCSCTDRTADMEGHIVADGFNYITTASPDEPVVEHETEAVPEEKETKNSIVFSVDSGVLSISEGETKKQDIKLGFDPVIDDIEMADYNFDGFDDIFVPYDLETSDMGLFYCYDSEKESYRANADLNFIGHRMTVTEDNTLLEVIDDGDDYYDQTIEFVWEDGVIKQLKRKVMYTRQEDGKRYEETYEYDEYGEEYFSGYEILD